MFLRLAFLTFTALTLLACRDQVTISGSAANLADILRSTNQDLGTLLSDPTLTAVTREFGPTVISPRSYPYKSGLAAAQSTPWSSWWFPKKEKLLFEDSRGNLSALSKYDQFRQYQYEQRHLPQPKSAAAFEQQSFNKNARPWEGLCDAWAIASILAPEPKHPVTIDVGSNSITFSVSDLKALLIKTYEAVSDTDLRYYGQKFAGDNSSWVFPDIFPDQFHRFVEVQLFEQHKAFVMDHDPGVEVWNVPVFKANYLMSAVAGDRNSVFVRMWIYSADPALTNEKETVGTKEVVREYDYILKGTRDGAGNLTVQSGYWVAGADGVNSRQDHPDYVIGIPDPSKVTRKSWNPEIDIELVDKILSQSY